MDGTSFLGAGEIPEIQQLIRDSLATALALSSHTIRIRRWDEAVEDTVELPTEYTVAIEWGNTQAQERRDVSTESSLQEGTVEGFAPLPLRVGDRFQLPGGSIAVVSPPEPREEFGIVTANWTVAGGTA